MDPEKRKPSGPSHPTESAVFLKELIDASPAIISLIDTEQWKVMYQNATGEKTLGTIVGKSCFENIPKMSANCPFCKAGEALKTGKMTSSEVPLPDGKWLLIQWSPVRTGETMLAVETIVDITTQKLKEEEYRGLKDSFEHLATIDPLTELLNRRGWFTLAERLCQRALQDKVALGVFIADLDNFKRVNDQYGHAVGDQTLQHVGKVMKSLFRPRDLLGRWGGEEFIMLLPSDDRDLLAIAAERVRKAVESSPFVSGDITLPLTVSLGGVSFTPAVGDRKELEMRIAQADQNMYLAKQQGRNRVVL